MDDTTLELLTRLSAEGADWDRPDAADFRTPDCLSINRLANLVDTGPAMSAVERSHLGVCHLCAARYRAFGGSDLPVSRSRAAGAWMGVIGALAACLLIWAMLTPRPIRPGLPLPVPSPVDSPADVVCVLGDSNCDGVVDSRDLAAFWLAVNRPDDYATQYPQCDLVCSNDFNGDCEVDERDQEEMVKCVGG